MRFFFSFLRESLKNDLVFPSGTNLIFSPFLCNDLIKKFLSKIFHFFFLAFINLYTSSSQQKKKNIFENGIENKKKNFFSFFSKISIMHQSVDASSWELPTLKKSLSTPKETQGRPGYLDERRLLRTRNSFGNSGYFPEQKLFFLNAFCCL